MIDRFGNKIVHPAQDGVDLKLLKAEIRFLLKGFAKDPTDTKAKLMAIKGEKLSAKLQSSMTPRADLKLLEELIPLLADHCRSSKDREAPWYMAWLCRNLHYSEKSIKAYSSSEMDYIGMSCLFFERYEQVEPTNQGRNLLINTYCIRASALLAEKDAQKDKQALLLLKQAKACEQRMDPEYSRNNRFLICETLYEYLYEAYLRAGRMRESFDALVQAIHRVQKGIAVKSDSRSMRSLARLCCLYTQHTFYDPQNDLIALQSVIEILEAYHKRSFFSGIQSYLMQLQKHKKT